MDDRLTVKGEIGHEQDNRLTVVWQTVLII